jgi:NADH dehydrogenase (ubiquinone) Fe-S protein 3
MRKYISFILLKDKSINVFIANDNSLKILKFLKMDCFFVCKQLLDLVVVDRLELSKSNLRFEYIYVLNSVNYNLRLFVRGFVQPFSFILSAINLFNSLNWLEREAWDMFGIIFVGHTDLRRILTDYGFVGSPFRKDFPLTGYVELRYDDILKSVVSEPLELSQEFRYFRLENAWRKL